MMFKKATYGLLFMLLGTAVWGSASAAGAATPPSKTFSVAIEPGSSEEVEDVEFRATFRNLAKEQTIGSANITVPDPFVLVTECGADKAPCGPEVLDTAGNKVLGATATIAGDVVQVRNFGLRAGRSLVVTYRADLHDVRGTWDTAVEARQANDFGGTGNGFTLVDGQLTTEVDNPAPSQTDCTNGVACEDTVYYKQPGGNSQAGAAGLLSLDATEAFTVTLNVVATPALPNNAGRLDLYLPVLPRPAFLDECKSVVLPDIGARVEGPPNRTKRVKFTIDFASDRTVQPPGMCYAAPFPFVADNLAVTTDPLMFVGTLKMCDDPTVARQATPCMSERKVENGNWVVTVEVPFFPEDPYYR